MLIKPNAIFTNQGLFKPGYSKQYFFSSIMLHFYPHKNKHIIPLALHNMKVALYKLGT